MNENGVGLSSAIDNLGLLNFSNGWRHTNALSTLLTMEKENGDSQNWIFRVVLNCLICLAQKSVKLPWENVKLKKKHPVDVLCGNLSMDVNSK